MNTGREISGSGRNWGMPALHGLALGRTTVARARIESTQAPVAGPLRFLCRSQLPSTFVNFYFLSDGLYIRRRCFAPLNSDNPQFGIKVPVSTTGGLREHFSPLSHHVESEPRRGNPAAIPQRNQEESEKTALPGRHRLAAIGAIRTI
ncbi:hypothetical protein [Variovorax sp. EL159]|uniref:hypothetical protein n=1 Tax=Variovorax sp. EL159 TaxID=1566270 RepID=UPI00115FDD35|nr:hypothetical protein [Variovorax sp. EL159]